MSLLVKICGVNSLEAADATVRAGADFAGLNFYARSPRNVRPDVAHALAERMRGRLRLVAVLCDPGDADLQDVIAAAAPDFIQFHGSETPERVGEVRSRFGLPVIKAIAVADASDLASPSPYEQVADMLLFDAKPASGADRTGGYGTPFDWQILRGRKFARPWLLAGGLDAENVGRALRICDAPGVDTASGVETAPGVKDVNLIAEFVQTARNARLAEGAEI